MSASAALGWKLYGAPAMTAELAVPPMLGARFATAGGGVGAIGVTGVTGVTGVVAVGGVVGVTGAVAVGGLAGAIGAAGVVSGADETGVLCAAVCVPPPPPHAVSAKLEIKILETIEIRETFAASIVRHPVQKSTVSLGPDAANP